MSRAVLTAVAAGGWTAVVVNHVTGAAEVGLPLGLLVFGAGLMMIAVARWAWSR